MGQWEMPGREKWGPGLMFLSARRTLKSGRSAPVGSGQGGDTHVCAEASAVGEDTWRLMGRGIWPSQEREGQPVGMLFGVKVA